MAEEKHLRFAIRAATQEDLPACLSLDHSTASEYVWQIEAQESPERVSYSFRPVRLPRPIAVILPQEPEALLVAWQQRDYFLVAEAEGAIYGYLYMRSDSAYGIGWIRGLVVDRPWRRRRIGSALLMQARKWARTSGLQRITVDTQTKNHPAIAFCQRHGLVFCGFNDHFYPNKDIALFFTQSVL
jgi:GNAT superfamily N-acetyltransferase